MVRMFAASVEIVDLTESALLKEDRLTRQNASPAANAYNYCLLNKLWICRLCHIKKIPQPDKFDRSYVQLCYLMCKTLTENPALSINKLLLGNLVLSAI